MTPTVEDVIAAALADVQWRHQYAAAVVAAVRAMSPEQLADLIGGITERGTFSRVVDGVPVATRVRVVGPWRAES